MKHALETHEQDGFIIRIFNDESPFNPREDDNLGTMICFHKHYNLGDKQDQYRHNDYGSWDEMEKDIIKNENVAVILPLYLYDHSGITMNTTGFGCRWDSGQVGFVYVSKESVRKEYNVKRINKELIEKVKSILIAEVKTYDQYLTGDFYGYEIHKVSVCDKGHKHEEFVDSCWGFSGDREYCMEEAKSIVKHHVENP